MMFAGVQCCHLPLFVYSPTPTPTLTPTLPNVLTTNTHGIRKHRTLQSLLFLPRNAGLSQGTSYVPLPPLESHPTRSRIGICQVMSFFILSLFID